jgi:hypothetical protein
MSKKPAQKKTAPKTAAKKTTVPKKAGPVAKVWEIASSMPKAERKDVLAACVKAGINEFTAKTQYQRWLHRDDTKQKRNAA